VIFQVHALDLTFVITKFKVDPTLKEHGGRRLTLNTQLVKLAAALAANRSSQCAGWRRALFTLVNSVSP
jgi:hypothetical protein